MRIPTYPESRGLELSDKQLFDAIFSETKPEICEYTFANLFAWRKLYDLKVSIFEDCVVLTSDREKKRYFLEPLGKGDKAQVMKILLNKTGREFRFISEPLKSSFENGRDFTVSPDKDNFDYVYSANELITLKGKKYDGKRNFIKRFKSENKYVYEALDGDNAKSCYAFAEEWCKLRDCEGVDSLKYESFAIREMLENFSGLGLSGGKIEIGGEICAFAIGEKLRDDTFVVHILKAKDGITGINQTMNNEFHTRVAAGYKLINLEQDLGLEGLRKSKLSYHPLKMMPKYIIKKA